MADLLRLLDAQGYAFVPPTTETLRLGRLRRTLVRRKSLTDLFGWNRALRPGAIRGAAIATIMAAFHTTAEFVTFGSPLVGNGSFARLFAERDVRRYVDSCDVPCGLAFLIRSASILRRTAPNWPEAP